MIRNAGWRASSSKPAPDMDDITDEDAARMIKQGQHTSMLKLRVLLRGSKMFSPLQFMRK